ncbi:MAG: DUF2867 domain-containing protein [Gilliamella sp.]|uniref:DUF2867 domain-containing protein n=1 Tax=Gilliamella sp. TaxID=1891236 RepID=UPI002613EE48|nr:DUF2867 domain-containing protein [Gilliamella sp.]MCO6551348.1 DUF2867 domain-containing protein [Gilliamella sp.]MCO6560539.1 DUF2867 domain-containing protein [Gilliamella sp.]
MKNKQNNIIKVRQTLPDNVSFIAEEIDYLDCQKKDISKKLTAYEVYKMMTSYQPRWLKILFKIRDCLVKLIGVKAINGFDSSAENKHQPDESNMADFFTITEETDDKLTLVVKDCHLDVCVCIRVVDKGNDISKNTVYLIASVKNHNIWGKLYMLPVAILHPYIVNKLFENIK